MYSYEDECICKSRTCILVANFVNNIGITLRETSEQTRFSRPTYFLVPTERNHHLSGAHCVGGGSTLKDRFPSRRQFLSHVTGSFGTNGQAPKVNRAKLFRTMRKHCLKGGKKEVGSSVTCSAVVSFKNDDIFNRFQPSVSFVHQGSLLGIGCNKNTNNGGGFGSNE
jgi:hypothetical protein